MKRILGEVWKDEFLPKGSKYGGQWNVQFPKGVMNFRTKKEAHHVSESIIEADAVKELDDLHEEAWKDLSEQGRI